MNGIGAKACNIFSKKFIIETVDANKGLKYTQQFENNMSKKNKPKRDERDMPKYHPFSSIQLIILFCNTSRLLVTCCNSHPSI